MKNKELKRLTRGQLLELLLAQTREKERLQEELAAATEKLRDRDLRMSQAGDLAQAVLAVNGVMDAAQEAAKQYLENIKAMQQRTKEECAAMLQDAWAEAQRITEAARNTEAGSEEQV